MKKNAFSRLARVVAVFLLVAPAPTTARDWIVAPSPGGREGNAGTPTSPLTFTAALQKAAPGDSLLLRGGVYDPNVDGRWIGPDWDGREGAPLRISPLGDETPIFARSKHDCLTISGDWVVVEGLTCEDSGHNGIAIWGGSHNVVRNNRIVRANENGIGVYVTDKNVVPVGNRIEGNEVAEASRRTRAAEDRIHGGWAQGINVMGDANVVRGNHVHHTWGEGIGCRGEGCVIVGNRIETNMSVGIYLDGARYALVARNHIVEDGNEDFLRGIDGGRTWRRANGIQLAAELSSKPLKGIEIRNNVIVGATHGIYYGNYGTNPGLDGVEITYNTIVDPTRQALSLEGVHGRRIFVRGNIFYRKDEKALGQGYVMNGVDFRGNAWFGDVPAAMRGSGDVMRDPRFEGDDPYEPASYRPLAGSPVIDSAPWPGPRDDFTGALRKYGRAPDMGAFERRG